MRFSTLLLTASLLLGATNGASASVTDLYAIDTASPRTNAGGVDLNNDNRLRSYQSGGVQIDGWMLFDLSSISDTANISALELTLFAEAGYGSPFGSPSIQVFRSSYDGWTRGGSGFPTSFDEALTGVDSGPFPSQRHESYTFTLDTSAFDWSIDLNDNFLSLVLRNDVPNSRSYWYGSDGVTSNGTATETGMVLDYRPTLRVVTDIAAVPLPLSLPLLASAFAGIAFLGSKRKTT